MVSEELSESITETLYILYHMKKIYRDKIPEKLMSFLEQNKSKTYKIKFDYYKKINEINLKEKTKDILAAIYMNYWLAESEKNEYQKILLNNEKIEQERLRQKYNPDNLFKKQYTENEIQENIVEKEIDLLEYKESIFKKFINRIKSIFNIRKKED